MKKVLLLFLSLTISLLSFSQQSDHFQLSNSRKAVKTSTDVVALALPTATLIATLSLKDWEGLKQGAFTAAATAGATLILKFASKEMRPDFSNHYSFPSSHSAVSFATAAFLQQRYGWKFGAPAYALAAYVGWGRVFAKKHYVWDVVAGAAIGAGAAYFFTTPFARKHDLNIVAVSDGDHIGFSASLSF